MRATGFVVASVVLLAAARLPPHAAAQEPAPPTAVPAPPTAVPAPPEVGSAAGSPEQALVAPELDTHRGFWATFAHTTPFGISTKGPAEAGAWGRTMDGVKRIWSEGQTNLIVSGYAWHLPWKHTTERQKAFNDAAWGGGFGRSFAENDRRQRLLYFVANNDSHERVEYMTGYAWLARYHPHGTLRLGVGYTLFLIGRYEYNYVPVPLILPAFSAGTDPVDVFVTYVPYGEVVLFVGRFAF